MQDGCPPPARAAGAGAARGSAGPEQFRQTQAKQADAADLQ